MDYWNVYEKKTKNETNSGDSGSVHNKKQNGSEWLIRNIAQYKLRHFTSEMFVVASTNHSQAGKWIFRRKRFINGFC